MRCDTVRIAFQKARAVLEAATPLNLGERDVDRMTQLIHVAVDYVEEALEDLGEGQP